MVNYWVFVSSDSSIYNFNDLETIKKNMIHEKKWLVGNQTPRRRIIRKGDKILFYRSGKGNRFFFGSAVLNSEYYPTDTTSGFVDLKEIHHFEESIPIKPLISSLSFIKIKEKYGLYLSGGINPISKTDYQLILKELE